LPPLSHKPFISAGALPLRGTESRTLATVVHRDRPSEGFGPARNLGDPAANGVDLGARDDRRIAAGGRWPPRPQGGLTKSISNDTVAAPVGPMRLPRPAMCSLPPQPKGYESEGRKRRGRRPCSDARAPGPCLAKSRQRGARSAWPTATPRGRTAPGLTRLGGPLVAVVELRRDSFGPQVPQSHLGNPGKATAGNDPFSGLDRAERPRSDRGVTGLVGLLRRTQHAKRVSQAMTPEPTNEKFQGNTTS